MDDPADGDPSTTPRAFPVSIKGVAVRDDRVLLLRNERGEWELPGGRTELGETSEETVVREFREEAHWDVTAGPLLDTWMYYIEVAHKHVFIVTYGCHVNTMTDPVVSHEHNQIGLFAEDEVATLTMPEGYKRSINRWFTHLRDGIPGLTARR